MTTPQQYDTIQAPYDYIRTATIAFIERANIHSTITPFIQDARILDLACGSGFYTHSFLSWGASSVVGVDISSSMLSANLSSLPPTFKDKVEFIQADCSLPQSYPGGPFDIVFGAWLLNYAPDKAGLVSMFKNISLNLKPGGRFISITVPPSSSPIDSINAETKARPLEKGGSGYLAYEHIRDVKDGVFFKVYGPTPVGEVKFECYHLKKEVYEEAAREAGLKGRFEWGVTWVPEEYLKGEGNVEGGASLEELESYVEVPNYGVLVIEK